MKKNRLILSGLAVALLGASAAFAAPHMGGFGPRPHGGPGMAAHSHEQREMKRIPDGAVGFNASGKKVRVPRTLQSAGKVDLTYAKYREIVAMMGVETGQ